MFWVVVDRMSTWQPGPENFWWIFLPQVVIAIAAYFWQRRTPTPPLPPPTARSRGPKSPDPNAEADAMLLALH